MKSSLPSFDQIDFGPGYIYAPYPVIEREAPIEEPNQVPIELRMTPPPALDPAMMRARLLYRDMIEEMARLVDKGISEALRRCSLGTTAQECLVFRHLDVFQPPAGVIIGDATA